MRKHAPSCTAVSYTHLDVYKRQFLTLNVKVGDRVLFGKYSGQTVKVDGDELLVMREEDLFAVVEK